MDSRALKALGVATLCAGGAAAIYVVAFRVHATAVADDRGFSGFRGLWQFDTLARGRWATEVVAPVPYAVAAVALPAVALLRRRPHAALAAVVVLVGANLTTQVLKRLNDGVSRPAAYYETLWPSGHATAVIAVAAALVIVSPPRLRPLAVGIGSVGSIVILYAVIISGMHHPSDVLAAVLVTGSWTAAASVLSREPLPARRPSVRVIAPTACVLIVVPVIFVLIRERARDVIDYASGNPALLGSAVAIGAATVCLLAATAQAYSAD